jgi:sulfur carrier protein ThiS
MQVNKYVGIKFKDKGRDTDGIDCWGLARLIYKNEYNIDLPSFTSEYEADDTVRMQELIAQYKEGWEELDKPTEGSIVVFRVLGFESHVGIAVSATHFLHAREGQDSAIESFDSAKWNKRIVGHFKYSEKKSAILNAVPHPLRTERYTIPIPPGTNLKQLVEGLNKEYNIAPELKSKVAVLLNGRVIDEANWEATILKETDTVEYRAVPGKSAVRMIAIMAIAYYAPMLAGQLTGYTSAAAAATTMGATVTTSLAITNAAVTMGLMMAGSALVNAIAPIRPPVSASGMDPGSAERRLMVNGGANQQKPYGAIPVVLGKVRLTPPLGSTNFLTYENERDSYLSMLLVWGYGPLSIDASTLRIGEIPLTSFTDYNYITLNRQTEPTASEKLQFDSIYGKDITQVNSQSELVCDGNPEVSVTPGPWFEAGTGTEYDAENNIVPVSSATVALHFPQGLRKIAIKGDNSGASYATSVQFRLEYSTNAGSSWNLLEQLTIGGDTAKKDGFTTTKTYSNLNHSQMIIRIRRETGDNTEDNENLRYYFTSVLQNVLFLRNANPAVDPVGSKIAKTAFKIKATDQLNGNIQGISAVVQTYCKVWNGSAWVDGLTSNPAALMRYVLEHPANPRKITNASTQINLSQLQYFHEYCTSKGFEYNGVLGDARSILEVIRDICAAGRASPALIDGKWSVVIDEPKTNIVQHFTPHNSWGFEGTKSLPKRPDGLRVTFFDQDKDYQESEIIVYDIGKTAGNSNLFESITLPGVTKKSLVIDHARWHMAQVKLRPEVYTLNSDIEYLVCNRGDRVKVMHDVPMWGIGSGRIKTRLSDTKLGLDESLPMKAGVNYTIRFRSKTGESVVRNVVSKLVDGYYSEIDLTSSVTTGQADVLDLFLFGELYQEAQDLVVLGIEPSNNKSARLTLIDYGVTTDYNIFTDYQNLTAFTVFESQITLPPALQIESFGTKVPQITGFTSDESVMEQISRGVFRYKISVSYVNSTQLPDTVESVEVQYDLLNSTANVNFRSVIVPYQNGSASIIDVNEGETYKIRTRYVSRTGVRGNWTEYSNHTVVGKTNPPSQVTAFVVSSDKSSGQLLLTWHDNPESDTNTYEIRTEDTGWGVNDVKRVFFGSNTKAFVTYATNGSATFYIRAVDSSGNYSQISSVVSFTPTTVPNVLNIDYYYSDTALTNATVTLDWNDVTNSQFDIAYYELSYDAVIKTVKANTITLPADWLGDRIFTIKAVDIHGNKSTGYSESVTKLEPNPPIDLKTQVIDNTVMLYWTLPIRTSLPIDHVLIKKGLSWNTATLIGDKKGAFTTITENQGGEYTYWLSAVDTEGVQSTPVSITTLVNEPPDFVFNGEFNSDFSGTKSSATFDGTVLALPVNTTETFDQHFSTRSWNTPQDQINAGYPIFIQPTTSSGYYEETFDFGVVLGSSRVILNYQGTIIAGTPSVTSKISLSLDNSTFVEYNGVTDVFGTNFRYVKIRITVEAPSNVGLYEISQISVRSDAKLKNDAGNQYGNSTDTLGTIVNFNKEFIDVQSITVSPSSTTPIIPVYDFNDNIVAATYSVTSNVCTVTSTAHGFITGQKVRLYFSSGQGITGVYVITSYTSNTFTVDMIVTNTSGNTSIYAQSFRLYLFNTSGTRVSSNTSWSVKGY